jgi:hypothetical protein
MISGTVTDNAGSAMPGISLMITNWTAEVTTNAAGGYTFVVDDEWSGTITPVKFDYTFAPMLRSYANLTENQTEQDYVGTKVPPEPITISGTIRDANGNALPGVSLAVSNSGLLDVVTDVNGAYSVLVDDEWIGVITPTKEGYTLNPENKSYSELTADKTGEDYVGTLIIIPGDVDQNGVVNDDDYKMALKAYLDLVSLSGEGFQAADIDGNGKLELLDLEAIGLLIR